MLKRAVIEITLEGHFDEYDLESLKDDILDVLPSMVVGNIVVTEKEEVYKPA